MSNTYQTFLNSKLSGKQRAALGLLYRRAYQRAVEHFATDDLGEADWRHEQCRRIAGVSISEATNAHFKMLRSYGHDLCGDSGKAFADALRMPEEETEFWRAQVRAVIWKWSGAGITNDYATRIAADKFGGKTPDQLVPCELEQLRDTLNNRGRAKQERADGTFDGSRRNKKQRRATASTAAAPALDGGGEARPRWTAPTLPARDSASAG